MVVSLESDTAAPWDADATRRRRRVHRVVGALLFGCLLALIAEFAPTSVGGSSHYLITSGTSMLPAIRAGSVVVIRAQEDYRVGEIVAYHNRDLNSVVLHRIVGRDGARYVFRGDNNAFADTYTPRRSDLIGGESLDIPTAGRVLGYLRMWWIGAIVVGVAAVWVLWGRDGGPTPMPVSRRQSAVRAHTRRRRP